MLGTLVAVQAGQSLITDGVGRDHALDSVGHSQIAVLSHQLAVLDLLQAADVLAVGDVELLLGLLAGQNSLIAVDDNNEIAAVHVGGVIDLLLAAHGFYDSGLEDVGLIVSYNYGDNCIDYLVKNGVIETITLMPMIY